MNNSFNTILLTSVSLFFLSNVAVASEPAGKPADTAESKAAELNSNSSNEVKDGKETKESDSSKKNSGEKLHSKKNLKKDRRDKKREQCPEDNGGFVKPIKENADHKAKKKLENEGATNKADKQDSTVKSIAPKASDKSADDKASEVDNKKY